MSLDEIGDLFGGEAGDLDPFELLPLGQALGQGLRRGARRLVGVVQAEQRAGDQRRVADHLAHVGGRQPVSVEDRIAEDLEQVGHETFVLPAPKRLQIELELLGQPSPDWLDALGYGRPAVAVRPAFPRTPSETVHTPAA